MPKTESATAQRHKLLPLAWPIFVEQLLHMSTGVIYWLRIYLLVHDNPSLLVAARQIGVSFGDN